MGWMADKDGSPMHVIYAGARDLPTHYYETCPHFGRRFERHNGHVKAYRLGPNSQVGSLISCKWCRSKWLEEQSAVKH